MKKNSVVIVDDYTLLTDAIASLVNSFDEFKVQYTCNNGQDLLDKLNSSLPHPDIVLMDISMPGLNGIQTTEILKKDHPNIHVLALTVMEDEQTIIDMLKAGAGGYVLKHAEKSTLEIALKEVMVNGYYHTRNVSNVLIDHLTGSGKSQRVALKEHEIKFIEYACSELTYKEIAKNMFRSPKTIDGYRDTIFKKLHVKNRIGLVLYAIKNKIINP